MTGSNDDLVAVSPRSGRAVSAAEAEPYAGKLLPLPRFVRKGGEPNWPEIRDGLELSGHFLMRDVLTGRSAGLAEARSRLVDRLLRAGGPHLSRCLRGASCPSVSAVTGLDTLAMLFPNVATTHGITVRVAVSYLAEQSDPSINRWFWSYHVRIENGAERSVQLLSRSWKITDGRGVVHEVHGEGVVGEMPLIAPDGSFDYVSGCPLDTPTGSMSGSYRMVDEDGGTFDVDIPKFALLAPIN